MPPEQRRASIVEAARVLLTADGITFTTREVAEAAGIAEGTVFRHFDTKDDLVQAVVDDVFDPRPLCAAVDATPPDLDLAGAVGHDMKLMRTHFQSIGEVMAALHHRPDRTRPAPTTRSDPATRPGPADRAGHRARRESRHRGMNDWYRAVADSLGHVLNRYGDSLRIPVDQACALLASAVLVNTRPGPIDVPRLSTAQLADVILNGIATDPARRPAAHPSSPDHSQESSCS